MNNNPLQHLAARCVLGPTLAVPVDGLELDWQTQPWWQQFTVQPIGSSAVARPPAPVATAHFNDQWVYLPRFRGLELVGGSVVHDRRTVGVQWTPVEFGGTLRPLQHQAVTATLARLREVGGAMLVLPCGFGKTVCALWVVHALGRRALVLVHSEALADQWAARVAAFLPGARVGRIQQARVEVEGCHVVIGMIQSLLRRAYPREVLSSFGTVVVDEAHHMAAPWFSGALRKLPARHVLGLSATPNRADGLGAILPWLLGPVAFRATRDADHVTVQVWTYVDARNQRELVDRRGNPRCSEMLSRIATNSHRTAWIATRVVELVRVGRRVIVLSDRCVQLESLQELLEGLGGWCVTKPATAAPTQPLFTVGRVVGGTRAAVRDAGFEASVLLSTYPYAAEGIDIPQLDTLVMATPRGNVEQTLGRILRPHPSKQTPLVIDVKDPFSLYEGMAWKRHHYYTAQGYEVEFFNYTVRCGSIKNARKRKNGSSDCQGKTHDCGGGSSDGSSSFGDTGTGGVPAGVATD